jgi:chromosome partitioning protein
MTTIITVANQKGGVGKTTTAVTLGHGLARAGRRVLVVDLDPQGHVAFALGLKKSNGLYRLLVEAESLKTVAITARPNLDIVASDKTGEAAKRYVTTLNFREKVLIRALKGAAYDVIVLDTPPSIDVLHVAALVASDWVIIPTRLDALAIDGVNEILRSMGEIEQDHRFDGYSIIPTFYDRTTKETATNLRELVEAFGDLVWSPIPQDTKAREATAFGQTLWEYSPESPSIMGYQIDGKRVGGYLDLLTRVDEVIA